MLSSLRPTLLLLSIRPFSYKMPLYPYICTILAKPSSTHAGLLSPRLSLFLPQCLAAPLYQHLHLASLRIADKAYHGSPDLYSTLITRRNLGDSQKHVHLGGQRFDPFARLGQGQRSVFSLGSERTAGTLYQPQLEAWNHVCP
jgi:hypothetical protein